MAFINVEEMKEKVCIYLEHCCYLDLRCPSVTLVLEGFGEVEDTCSKCAAAVRAGRHFLGVGPRERCLQVTWSGVT